MPTPPVSRVVVNKPKPLEPRFVKERDALQAAFGSRVRQFRVEKQLTLQMLGERADLHENYIGEVERGVRNPSLYNVWRIAHALGIDPAELVSELPTRDRQA